MLPKDADKMVNSAPPDQNALICHICPKLWKKYGNCTIFSTKPNVLCKLY